MKRYAMILATLMIFAAGVASAAIIITLNGYSNIAVTLEPIGLCGSTGDCVFNVTVRGMAIDSGGSGRSVEEKQFRTDDPVYLASPYNINPTTTTTLYRKSRRVWKLSVLADGTD